MINNILFPILITAAARDKTFSFTFRLIEFNDETKMRDRISNFSILLLPTHVLFLGFCVYAMDR